MNFAQAVKGHKAKIKSIWSQAETELGRKPTHEEQKVALNNSSPEKLMEEIEKVIIHIIFTIIHYFLTVWIWAHELPNIYQKKATAM